MIQVPHHSVFAAPALGGETDIHDIRDCGERRKVMSLVTRHDASNGICAATEHTGGVAVASEALAALGEAFMAWLRLSALPVWATLGVSPAGWFHESMTADGRPLTPFRRARVQPRQAYSFCLAGALGWCGPWKSLAERSMNVFEKTNGLSAGGYRTCLSPEGSALDDTAFTYDLAFVLLAWAALEKPDRVAPVLSFLDSRAHSMGGYREVGERPFQANATMHLFEAFLAWEVVEPNATWTTRADGLASLAINHLMDAKGGFIPEFYDSNWCGREDLAGQTVKPGHQFEWAFLLQLWAARRGNFSGTKAARKLFQAGRRGVDAARDVVVDELDVALGPARLTARLWPQVERMKAALVLAMEGSDPEMLDEARLSLATICRYLKPTGIWGDRMGVDGQVDDGPAPASSLYHLMTGAQQLAAASRALKGFGRPLDLT